MLISVSLFSSEPEISKILGCLCTTDVFPGDVPQQPTGLSMLLVCFNAVTLFERVLKTLC